MSGTVGDWIEQGAAVAAGALGFEFVDGFTRLRGRERPDPYAADGVVIDWADPEQLIVWGFLASTSSSDVGGEVRTEQLSERVLTLGDPDADVRAGDRFVIDGATWSVDGVPSRDRNPWTGARPSLVVRLKRAVG